MTALEARANPQVALEVVDSIGSLLQRKRIARHWEPQDIAAQLSLDVSIIRAIEENDFEKLGPAVFARGHIVQYGELVGVPRDETISRYNSLGASEAPPLRVNGGVAETNSRLGDAGLRWAFYLLILGVLGYVGMVAMEKVPRLFNSDESGLVIGKSEDGKQMIALPKPAGFSKPVAGQQTLALPQLATKPALPIIPAPTNSGTGLAIPALAQAPVTEPVPVPTAAQVTAVQPISETPALVQSAVPAPVSESVGVSQPLNQVTSLQPGLAQLLLEFNEDCWVDVKDASGRTLLSEVVGPDNARLLNGEAPFKIVLGNSGAATVSLNGRTIDPTVYNARRGKVARFTVGAEG